MLWRIFVLVIAIWMSVLHCGMGKVHAHGSHFRDIGELTVGSIAWFYKGDRVYIDTVEYGCIEVYKTGNLSHYDLHVKNSDQCMPLLTEEEHNEQRGR